MQNESEQHSRLPIGAIGRWNGERWEPLTGIAATAEAHQAFAALYDLLAALNTFDQIDLTQLMLASPAATWQDALEQGIAAYHPVEALVENWAIDLNNAVLRAQDGHRERES